MRGQACASAVPEYMYLAWVRIVRTPYRTLRRRGRSRIASIAPITSKTQVPVIRKRTSVFAGGKFRSEHCSAQFTCAALQWLRSTTPSEDMTLHQCFVDSHGRFLFDACSYRTAPRACIGISLRMNTQHTYQRSQVCLSCNSFTDS